MRMVKSVWFVEVYLKDPSLSFLTFIIRSLKQFLECCSLWIPDMDSITDICREFSEISKKADSCLYGWESNHHWHCMLVLFLILKINHGSRSRVWCHAVLIWSQTNNSIGRQNVCLKRKNVYFFSLLFPILSTYSPVGLYLILTSLSIITFTPVSHSLLKLDGFVASYD